MTLFCGINKSKLALKFILFSIIFLLVPVYNESVRVCASQPSPHSKLAEMQSLSIKKINNISYFGKSRKYRKHGIQVIVLTGNPYELGYARGVLLQDQIKQSVREFRHVIKKKLIKISLDENVLTERAKSIEKFIPSEYREELLGVSAGSEIDYEMLLIINVLSTISTDISCTSVVIKNPEGSLIRSRNLDLRVDTMPPAALYLYQPADGHAFVSISHLPWLIGTKTAFNETGLSIGAHGLSRTSNKYTEGEPEFILRRRVAQYAGSVKQAGRILSTASRSVSKIWLVADSQSAGIYEFTPTEVAFHSMDSDYLILTNHTRILNIGGITKSSFDRYKEAETFLQRHGNQMSVKQLIDLNRGDEICFTNYRGTKNLHSAIFKADTLDFWVAVGSPPATRGKWIGFNFYKELLGTGDDPQPLLVPALD